MPTAYFPSCATFGGWALVVTELAVTAGAVATTPVVNRPATTVTTARRARQRRGVRASIIVPLRSLSRSLRLLLQRRNAGLVGIVAQPLERASIALQVAVEEVERNVRDRGRRGIRSAPVGRSVPSADECEEELRRARLGEGVGTDLVGDRPVGVTVLGQQRRRDAGEILRRVACDTRHRRRRPDAFVGAARLVDEPVCRESAEGVSRGSDALRIDRACQLPGPLRAQRQHPVDDEAGVGGLLAQV